MITRNIVSGLLALAATATPVLASTSTSSMGVSATVNATCSVAATPLAFGNYSGTQLDQSSALTVTCSDGTPYAIALGNGSSSGASADQRQMTGPNSATLGYTIYSDAAHSSVWGSGTVGTVVNNVGSGLPQNLPAYGRVHSAQAPSPGVYQDTVVVTLTY